MRLLYITNQICGSGGLERVLSIKASYLAEKLDYDIHILTLNQFDEPLFYEFSKKITLHDITVKGNLISYFNQYRKGIRKIYKQLDPDIVIVCDDGLKGLLLPPLLIKGKPLVYERHVSKNIELKSDSPTILSRVKTKITHSLMNYGAKKYDRFVVLTKGNATEWNSENVVVIPNPMSFAPNEYSDVANKIALVVGRHAYQKGYDRLLKIWAIAHKNFPEWKLNIYGKINKSLGYEDLAIELGLQDSVNFFNPVKNIQEKYKESSIYAMSSRFEGFPMVLIEAMGYGLPCISFDCPWGPEEAITDGENGFIIENGDIPDFAEKLELLMDRFELRQRMGKHAVQKSLQYLPERIVPLWDKLFKELLREYNH